MLFSQDITVLLTDVKNSRFYCSRVFYYSLFISLVFRWGLSKKRRRKEKKRKIYYPSLCSSYYMLFLWTERQTEDDECLFSDENPIDHLSLSSMWLKLCFAYRHERKVVGNYSCGSNRTRLYCTIYSGSHLHTQYISANGNLHFGTLF